MRFKISTLLIAIGIRLEKGIFRDWNMIAKRNYKELVFLKK
ncbi:hypothetical protein N288_03990 [Bacillus infantis NRRL B-14911]|uniref:Uncharacterized protein n=1 Tax=Bacillus infantis NRRL B-14911 TaxID=1367477 RepID=U5L808_9BACI|nr:hypothetical protein N288_03990 [Bacillus infantis NRRL B-14911]